MQTKYMDVGSYKYKIDNKYLDILLSLSKKVQSFDILCKPDGTLLIYGEDSGNGAKYIFTNDNSKIIKYTEKEKINRKDLQNIVEEDIVIESLDVTWDTTPEQHQNTDKQQVTSANNENLVEDFEIVTQDTNQSPITKVNNEEFILRFRVDKGFIDTLVTFKEGTIKADINEVFILTRDTKIKFVKLKSYATLELLEKLTDNYDASYVDITPFKSIIKALNVTEKEKYKYFICIQDSNIFSYTNSIYMYSKVNTTLKESYLFNYEMLKIIEKTGRNNDLWIKKNNNTVNLIIGTLTVIIGETKINNIQNIVKGVDLSKSKSALQTNQDFLTKLNLISNYKTSQSLKLIINYGSTKLISKTIETIVQTKSSDIGEVTVDIELLKIAIKASNSKEPSLEVLEISPTIKVMIIKGETDIILKIH